MLSTPPAIQTQFPLTEALIQRFAPDLGPDLTAYRNHVYRVLNFYQALANDGQEAPRAVQIAAAFHDIGIWSDHNFDYLAPSVQRAHAYLAEVDSADLRAQVQALIEQHHKIRPYTGPHANTVELFRRADWADVSLGWLRSGLPAQWVQAVRQALPNAGLHRRLVQLTARQMLKTPWQPLPMMRW